MSYTKATQPRIIPIVTAAQIAATTTLRGPKMTMVGEVVGCSISSSSNHLADNGSGNYYTIVTAANGNTAFSLNTAVTNINNATVSMTENTTPANKRFAIGDEITVVFTKTSSPVNIPPGATVWVSVMPDYDYAGE